MVAKILISPEKLARQKYIDSSVGLKKGNPDLLYFDPGEKLGIAQSRKIIDFLSIKPFAAKGRVVVIEDASGMTHEAQNALLKSLEELPKNTVFIMAADNNTNFLPTVLSRCEVIYLSGQTTGESQEIEKLLNSPLEDRFAYIEKCKDRDKLFKDLIFALHLRGVRMNEILEAEKWAASNGNIRAILEYLMLVC